MATGPVISVEGLVKYFDGRCVLDGIDLHVEQGCVYGLLGRNGAGKTTMIRILLGQDFATRGRTRVFGTDSAHIPSKVLAHIGYVAEGHNLIQHYRVRRLVNLCRKLAGQWNDTLFDHLAKTFHLPMDCRVREMSIGMRAQLNLALAIAVDPELLVLDDPTLGLDTVARRQFLELTVDLLQRQGRTILFSSHILGDVERIADRIGILRGGKLIVDCPLDDLKQRVKKLRLIFADKPPVDLHMTDIINRQTQGREMVITIANMNPQKQAIIDTFKPSSCTEIPMSLEDIFIECTRLDGQTTPAEIEE
ncbi:MAG: hypothetical protein DRI48_09915 [Chloroflexi bacterium]|nr:MAG: hypothetical protein DRI48_09915 [Chloroflexota bacterium]